MSDWRGGIEWGCSLRWGKHAFFIILFFGYRIVLTVEVPHGRYCSLTWYLPALRPVIRLRDPQGMGLKKAIKRDL